MEYEPTRTLLATVCLNTSTFKVSAKISSVSYTVKIVDIFILSSKSFLFNYSRKNIKDLLYPNLDELRRRNRYML